MESFCSVRCGLAVVMRLRLPRKNYVHPLNMVYGFHPTMIKYCSMHTLHLGLLHFLNGGALITLAENGWLGGDSKQKISTFAGTAALTSTDMEQFTLRFHRWCAVHGVRHGQPVITKNHLHFDMGGPELRLKAYATRVMCAFLAVCLRSTCEKIPREEASQDLILVTAATAQMANWSLLLEESPLMLSPERANLLFDAGMQQLDARHFLDFSCLSGLRGFTDCWPCTTCRIPEPATRSNQSCTRLGLIALFIELCNAQVFLEILWEMREFKESCRPSVELPAQKGLC